MSLTLKGAINNLKCKEKYQVDKSSHSYPDNDWDITKKLEKTCQALNLKDKRFHIQEAKKK